MAPSAQMMPHSQQRRRISPLPSVNRKRKRSDTDQKNLKKRHTVDSDGEENEVSSREPSGEKKKGKSKAKLSQRRELHPNERGHRSVQSHVSDSNMDLSDSGADDDEFNQMDVDFLSEDGKSDDERNVPEPASTPTFQKKKERNGLLYVRCGEGRDPELYRWDVVRRLREGGYSDDSDDEDGSDGLTKLSDKWRAEWNRGVQIPVHPESLGRGEVEVSEICPKSPGRFTLPQKRISSLPSTAENSTKSSSRKESAHSRRLYHGDRLDEIWSEKKNISRNHMNLPPIPMPILLSTMEEFEKQCYRRIHEIILAPLSSPSEIQGADVDEDAACDICRSRDCEPEDAMVFCDQCNMCVHMSCYGLTELPQTDWYCMKCREMKDKPCPPCILCPVVGGALKKTEPVNGKEGWAHVACALWMYECRFGDVEKREPVTKIEDIPIEKWVMKCSICDTRQGACIQCTKCKVPFHATCALRSGYEMRIESDEDPTVDVVHFISLCDKHGTAASPQKPYTHHASDEEDICHENSKLRRLEAFFYLYADCNEIMKKLNLDRLTVLSIYEYWKLKRAKNNNKALIHNLQDHVTLDTTTLVLGSISPIEKQVLTDKVERGVAELAKLQRYVKDVRSRTKAQKQLSINDSKLIQNVFNIVLGPVPQSHRSLRNLVDSVLGCCSAEEIGEIQNALAKKNISLFEDEASSSTESSSRSSSLEPQKSRRKEEKPANNKAEISEESSPISTDFDVIPITPPKTDKLSKSLSRTSLTPNKRPLKQLNKSPNDKRNRSLTNARRFSLPLIYATSPVTADRSRNLRSGANFSHVISSPRRDK